MSFATRRGDAALDGVGSIAHPNQVCWQSSSSCLSPSPFERRLTDGSATFKALDYSLRRWGALTRFLSDGHLPVDNNHIENQIRPIAIGRNNWLFAGSLRAGKRAAAVMSLIQSAKLNGHDPYTYLTDVLTRLPIQRASQIHELLPHRWQPQVQAI